MMSKTCCLQRLSLEVLAENKVVAATRPKSKAGKIFKVATHFSAVLDSSAKMQHLLKPWRTDRLGLKG